MNMSLAFTRFFFLILSIFFMTTYMVSLPDGSAMVKSLTGLGIGTGFGLL